LHQAVEDLDRPSSYEAPPAYSPPAEERPAPPPSEYSAPGTVASEQPRRRSTIREPASPAGESAPNPAPAPVVSSTGSEESAPKRGWWGKRLLGDKG
jgi:hypothetical protein